MAGKLGHLAAFLVKSHPAAALLHVEVFNLHADGRSDAGEGAAGQAIQCANLSLGLKESTGLPIAGMWP